MFYSEGTMLPYTQCKVSYLQRNTRSRTQLSGFTIVELLIVIVVIAILATIVTIAYNGIQNQARDSSVQTSVKQASTKILTHAVLNNDDYPANLAVIGIASSGDTSYQYTVNNSATPRAFCVSVTEGTISYTISNTSSTPTAGTCNSPPVVVSSIFGSNALNGAVLWSDGGGSIILATIFYSYDEPFQVEGGRVYLPEVPADTTLTIFYIKSWNVNNKVRPPDWTATLASISGQYVTLPNSSLKTGWNEVTFPTKATINPYSAGVDGTSVWIGYFFSNGNFYVYAPSPQGGALASATNAHLFLAEHDFEDGNRSVHSLGGGTGNLYGIDILTTEP